MASNWITKLSEEEYLALDRAAEIKSEYFYGEMFAMSGASMRHADLQSNLQGEFYINFRTRECRVYGPDFRVRISSAMYTYPDISVVCGKPLLADENQDALLNPVVIVEVLSPSTEKYDRGVKLQHYRTIATLQDYILVDQGQIWIEQYTRQENKLWTLRDYVSLEEELIISSIGLAIPLQRIYDHVDFPAN